MVDHENQHVEDLDSVDYVTDDTGAPTKEIFDAALTIAASAGWLRVSGALWDGDGDAHAYVISVQRA